jgi:hypothetical protein
MKLLPARVRQPEIEVGVTAFGRTPAHEVASAQLTHEDEQVRLIDKPLFVHYADLIARTMFTDRKGVSKLRSAAAAYVDRSTRKAVFARI